MAITQAFLDRFWIFLVQMNTKGPLFVPCISQWITQPLREKTAITQLFPGQFWIFFGTNEHQRIPFLSHVVLNGITQPLREKLAIIQPFLYPFGFFLVQMNTNGSSFVQYDSQWNHTFPTFCHLFLFSRTFSQLFPLFPKCFQIFAIFTIFFPTFCHFCNEG